jgi:RNA polymerase sigma-70 factor (ECF subfamily)
MTENPSFASLYAQTASAVYDCAYILLKNRASAEDIVQTAFFKLFQNDSTATPILNKRAWLLKTARNLSLNLLRDRSRETEFSENEDILSAIFEDDLVFSMEIRRGLCVLNDAERQAFVLHYVDGYKYRELAEVFELPVSTVKTHCRSACKKLRAELTKQNRE